MKKIIFTTLLLFAGLVHANGYHGHHRHYHRHYHGHYYGQNHWIAPLIIGGVIGYEINRQQQPATVVIQQQTIPASNNCTPWQETMNSDGTITKTRSCQN